jgi:hypothetical protein
MGYHFQRKYIYSSKFNELENRWNLLRAHEYKLVEISEIQKSFSSIFHLLRTDFALWWDGGGMLVGTPAFPFPNFN